MKYFALTVAVLVLLVVSFLCMVDSVREYKEKGWRKTEGTVLSVRISEAVAKNGIGAANAREKLYVPIVQYKYKVDDIEYYGFNVSGNDEIVSFFKESECERYIAEFKEGNTVKVYYRVSDFSVSALKVNEMMTPVKVVTSVVIFVLAVFIVQYAYFEVKRKKQVK